MAEISETIFELTVLSAAIADEMNGKLVRVGATAPDSRIAAFRIGPLKKQRQCARGLKQ